MTNSKLLYRFSEIKQTIKIVRSLESEEGYEPPPKYDSARKIIRQIIGVAEWFQAFKKRKYPRHSRMKWELTRYRNRPRKWAQEIRNFLEWDPETRLRAGINPFDLEDIEERLLNLSMAADAGLRKIPRDEGAPNPNVARREIILGITHIVEKATGKWRNDPDLFKYDSCDIEDFSGLLFDLINAVYEPLDLEWVKKSNCARGNVIKRHFNWINPLAPTKIKRKGSTLLTSRNN